MGDFNFKKLISLEERVFSLYGGEGNRGQVHMGDSDNGNQSGV